MSELKAFRIKEVEDGCPFWQSEYEVYSKQEVDKELRRLKYKRCIAMAERCKYRMYYLAAVVEASKILPLKAQIQWYQKRENRMDYWKNRWLELAEQFKENK